ncbi:solute carrier family 46 member 3-like [Leptidea sinapis]|uniref:solute carrier family 46 member 3-like n=1 Tax=Leptidea sinapis TaxID=189913 RepID=UPI00212C006A|nr:solute carrier family 46 member 3-like [Leptidea sinapis]
MTIVEASVSVGSVIGSVASSYLLRAVGNVYLLLITSSLYVIAYVFTNVVLEESLRGAVKGGLKSVLNISLIKEMITECFKERPNHGRAQILLLTVANSLSVFILYGVMSLEYLYTRHKLNWAIKQYTLYSAVHTTVNFVGAFFGVVVVQRLFHVTDLAFSIVAFLSATSEHLIKAFAVMSWHLYLGAGIAVFRGLSSPLIRSMLTKILPPQDIAKVFALMCAIEGVSPLVSPALYNSLYAYTISSFPGAIYILSCGITGLCAIFLGFVQYFRWNSPSIIYDSLNENQEGEE